MAELIVKRLTDEQAQLARRTGIKVFLRAGGRLYEGTFDQTRGDPDEFYFVGTGVDKPSERITLLGKANEFSQEVRT